jgi:hypothetical protein
MQAGISGRLTAKQAHHIPPRHSPRTQIVGRIQKAEEPISRARHGDVRNVTGFQRDRTPGWLIASTRLVISGMM